MASEALLQNYLIKQAQAHGIYARKLVAVGRTGFPDVMIAFDSKVLFIELKSPTGRGRLSKKQDREIKRMLDVGLFVIVLQSREEVDEVLRKILNR